MWKVGCDFARSLSGGHCLLTDGSMHIVIDLEACEQQQMDNLYILNVAIAEGLSITFCVAAAAERSPVMRDALRVTVGSSAGSVWQRREGIMQWSIK